MAPIEAILVKILKICDKIWFTWFSIQKIFVSKRKTDTTNTNT